MHVMMLLRFLNLLKAFLHVKVSQKQLHDKIRRLKQKYKNNKEKIEDGQTLDFSRSDEEKLFMLSLKIWGSENKEKKQGEEEDFWSMYPRLNESLKLDQFSEYTLPGYGANYIKQKLPGYGANYIKQKLSCIGNSKAEELEEKWRKLQVAETQFKLMKARLIEEQTELILKSIS
ncbi:STOREKEEPER protein-like [Jatropha curcas]|uniref:STOREKEEPER protein-like n=1 Tax=Jatropha curcas TaxID=180498 RepID=UPI001895C1AD|nr:STOREKEEPER protein-like [Jatropha curcas]